MRSFLALFLLSFFVRSSFTCKDDFRCCIKKVVHPLHDRIFNKRTLSAQSYNIYRVMGLTTDCHVFYGWLHDVWNTNENTTKPAVSINTTSKACRLKKIMYLKTQGIVREMILIVDAVGRRVRVQNAMSSVAVDITQKDLIWLKADTTDRQEMIYTGPVDRGFTIVNFFNANYRVFVIARSTEMLRVYEMRMFIDDDNTPHAHLRRHTVDVNPLIFPPIDLFTVRVVHNKESSMMIVPGEQAYSEIVNDTVSLPLVSLLTSSIRFVDISFSTTQFVYQPKEKEFTVQVEKECDVIFPSYMFYQYQRVSKLLSPLWSGFPMTTRRTLNGRNIHRRMAYPHVIRRRNRLQIRAGWAKQFGVFVGIAAGIFLLVLILRLLTTFVQRRLKKKGTTTTRTH